MTSVILFNIVVIGLLRRARSRVDIELLATRKLETGVYGCTGKIALLHSDGSEKSSISMPVTITILK